MKVIWQWPPAIMYCVTLLVLGFLVYTGKLHSEALLAQLTWLAPSPLQANPFQIKKRLEDEAKEKEEKDEQEKPETD